jgi:hypothetical protein
MPRRRRTTRTRSQLASDLDLVDGIRELLQSGAIAASRSPTWSPQAAFGRRSATSIAVRRAFDERWGYDTLCAPTLPITAYRPLTRRRSSFRRGRTSRSSTQWSASTAPFQPDGPAGRLRNRRAHRAEGSRRRSSSSVAPYSERTLLRKSRRVRASAGAVAGSRRARPASLVVIRRSAPGRAVRMPNGNGRKRGVEASSTTSERVLSASRRRPYCQVVRAGSLVLSIAPPPPRQVAPRRGLAGRRAR